MNIGIFTESYKPYLSGVTVSVDTFAKSCAELGNRVHVFAPWYPDHTDQNKNPFIFRFASLGTPMYKGFRVAIPFSFRYRHYISTVQLDVIHSHTPYQLGWKAFFTSRRLNIPFVYTFHTLFTEYLHFIPVIPQSITAPIVRFLVRSFCNNLCDHVIVPTEKTKVVLQKEYGVTAPIDAIPTGVLEADVSRASADGIREKLNVSKDTFLLLYVGRFSKEKNIYFLLRMFKRVCALAGGRDIKLMLIARGPLEQEVKAYVQNEGMSSTVVFTGEVKREEIYNYYKAADLFVCASKTETQGLVLSEAKACTVPSVAIDAAGVSEMVNHGRDGFLVPEDEEVFAQHVLQLVRDPGLLGQFAAGARKDAEERFLDIAVARKLMAIYTAVIDKRKRSNA